MPKEKLITITPLQPSQTDLIRQIAGWYRTEWGTPEEKNIARLSNHPSSEVISHMILSFDGEVIGAGGLWNDVNIYAFHGHLKKYRPWVSALYILESHRRKGLGGLLLEHIELRAKELGLEKLYLYTFTARELYEKNGWEKIDSLEYKGKETVVMEKQL